MLSGVSRAGPHSPCNYKNNNLSKNTSVQWRAPQIHNIKSNTIDTRIFTEVWIHCMYYTSLVNSTLRWGAPRSLPAKTLHKHTLTFHYLDSLPIRRWKLTLTNFPRQPTQLDARRATPSLLGAKAPRVTNAKHTISAKLKCWRFVVLSNAFKLSLSQTQLKDITRIAQSHKERLRRAQQDYQAFLRWLASSKVMPGIAAHQGGGLRV
jgi:hypothetical protein